MSAPNPLLALLQQSSQPRPPSTPQTPAQTSSTAPLHSEPTGASPPPVSHQSSLLDLLASAPGRITSPPAQNQPLQSISPPASNAGSQMLQQLFADAQATHTARLSPGAKPTFDPLSAFSPASHPATTLAAADPASQSAEPRDSELVHQSAAAPEIPADNDSSGAAAYKVDDIAAQAPSSGGGDRSGLNDAMLALAGVEVGMRRSAQPSPSAPDQTSNEPAKDTEPLPEATETTEASSGAPTFDSEKDIANEAGAGPIPTSPPQSSARSPEAVGQPKTPTPAPTRSMFDFVSPFDLLARDRENFAASPTTPSKAPKNADLGQQVASPGLRAPEPIFASSGYDAASRGIANILGKLSAPKSPSIALAPAASGPSPANALPAAPSATAPEAVLENTNEELKVPEAPIPASSSPATPAPEGEIVLEVDRSKHASSHLATDQSTDSTASRTASVTAAGIQVLDLSRASPAGPGTLYPAKLELTPIALLPTPFAYRSGGARVAHLGPALVCYAMSKRRVRIIHTHSGARALLQTSAGERGSSAATIRALAAFDPDAQAAGSAQTRGRRSTAKAAHSRDWLLAGLTERERLVLWSVPHAFGAPAQESQPVSQAKEPEMLAELVGEVEDGAGRFRQVAWHPKDPDCLAVLTSSNEVLRLNVLELMSAGEPGKPVQESVIRRRGNVYEHSESVAAFTFSPDGSLLATLTSADSASANATLRFFSTFSTSGPSAIQVMNVSQPPGVNALAGDERGISHFTLVSAPEDDSVRAALIGYGRNRLLGLWDLGEQRWRDVWRFDDAGDGHYNQVSYHSATGTLLIANSFRSSIFSIRFAFSSMPPAPSEFERSLEPGELAEDSQLLPARLRQGSQAFPWTVEVLRISEMAVPEPTVSFVAARTDPSAGEAQGLNIFAAHPRGIHALAVPEEAMRVIAGQAKPAAPQAQNEVTTRPSNENEAETWVAVTPPTTSAPRHEDSTATPAPKPESVTPARIATPSSDREGKRQKAKAKKAAVSASPAPVPAPAPTTVPAPPESVAAKEPASGSENLPSSELADAKLSGPVINGAIKELKKANTNGKKSHSRSASHASQGPSSKHAKMENNGTATPVHAAEATTAAPTAVSASSEELKGLFADLEDRLAARLLPSPRATEAVPAPPAPAPVDLSGLEQSLAKLMLDSKPTDKQLEPIIRNEMQRTVLPAVTATVREAVNQHIGYGLADSMKVALPSELQKLLLRPDVSSHLTRSFASGVLPLVERTVSESIMQVLVPQFQDATDAVADRVLREIHAEVTGVRKTIVAEQSEALKETEVRMREMARQMEAMQAQMAALVRSNERLSQSVAQMERRAPITQAQPVPEQPPSRASIAQVVSPAYQTAQHTPPAAATVAQQQKAAASSAAPPPPAATPAVSNQPDDIEDRFLTALSHSDPTQAEYRWLHELLTSFAYQGGPAAVLSKGLLSQPVILTLLHRLATSLVDPSSGTGAPAPAATLAYPHLPYELAVPWIEASAQALRPQEQAIAAYYPRVSELVRRALIVAQQAAQPHQQHLRRPGAVLAPWWSEERLRAAALAYLP